MGDSVVTKEKAGFAIRLGAFILDLLVIAAINTFVRLFATGLLATSIRMFVPLVYYAYFYSTTGQTPGKKAFGLRVVRSDGQPLNVYTGILRAIGLWASTFLLGIGYILVLFDKQKQGLHDKIANTFVIRE